ncbi:MAG: hypothetical protein ABIH22_02195, partial [Candidatus Margulisiibacteriota bacterium]
QITSTKPEFESHGKIPRFTRKKIGKIAAATLAAATVTLVPAVALAAGGPLAAFGTFFGGLSLLGKVGFIAGGCLAVKMVLTAWREIKPQNYQSRDMQLNVGNPTPRKLWDTLVKPVWLFSFAAGTTLTVLPAIGQLLSIPKLTFSIPMIVENASVGWGSLIAYGLLAAIPVTKMIAASIRDISHWIQYKRTGIQPNLFRQTLISKVLTNIFSPLGWLSTISFMGFVTEIYASHTLRTIGSFVSSIPAAFTTTAGLGAMGQYALLFALPLAAYRFIIGWPKAKIGSFSENITPRLKSTLKWAGVGAAIGAGLSLAGPGMVINNLIIFAINVAFMHNFFHSTRSQETALHQAHKKLPIYDHKSLWEAVRGAWGATRTVFKPSIDMIDPYVSAYVMTLISQGANWVLSGVCGAFVAPQYRAAEEMREKLLTKDMRIVQKTLQDGYHAMKAASTNQQAVDAAAVAFENMARLFIDPTYPGNEGHPLALGNLRSRSGIAKLKNHTYSAGIPGSEMGTVAKVDLASFKDKQDQVWDALIQAGYIGENGKVLQAFDAQNANLPIALSADELKAIAGSFKKANDEADRSDQDLRTFGEELRFAARFFEVYAGTLRNLENREKATLESLKEFLSQRLEASFRRASVIMDTHPGRFWENILPDSYNAKQFIIDLCFQIMADFVGGMEIVVMTPDGTIHEWLVPMKVVKDFKEGHHKVLAIESSNVDLEDKRFEWYPRADHDIGNSLCDIAYFDNSAHFHKYKKLHDLGPTLGISHEEYLELYPTAEVPTVPTLKMDSPTEDPYTGKPENHEFYDLVYKNGSRLRVFADGTQKVLKAHQQADGSVVIEESHLDADAPAVIMVPGTQRHQHVANMIQANHAADIFRDVPLDPELAEVLAKGTVPHPFGGYFTDNKYVAPRWHFMSPTEYTSVSDGDQMDKIVTNLRLHHTNKNPHLRVMMMRPRTEQLPYSPDMLDSPNDSFLEVGAALAWMTLKLKFKPDKDGQQRELFIPLNRNKESEHTWVNGKEFWRYMDETKPVGLVKKNGKHFLKIPYRKEALKDPDFRAATRDGLMLGGKYNFRESIEMVPVPLEMEDLVEDISEVRINPERYGDVGGPRPVADYFFVRRNESGYVTDRDRNFRLTNRLADMLIFGKTALLSHTEIDHWETVTDHIEGEEKIKNPKDHLPWTDENGWVHLKMSQDELTMLEDWLPAYYGAEQPHYENGELLVKVRHFEQLCEHAFDQFAYRRFMPDYEYRVYFDPAHTDLEREIPDGLADMLAVREVTEDNGQVRISMSEYDYTQLQGWLPKYKGQTPTEYKDGELVMPVEHFKLTRDKARQESGIKGEE